MPIEVRRFAGEMAKRMVRMSGTLAVRAEKFGTSVLISDVKDAFMLSDSTIKTRLTQMDTYGIGDLDEIDSDFGLQPAIRIRSLESGWPIWLDIVQFCEETAIPIGRFSEDLEFSLLDEDSDPAEAPG